MTYGRASRKSNRQLIGEFDAAERIDHTGVRFGRRAIAVGGACACEHGIGQKKMAYMEEERGPAALDLMRRVKAASDPKNLFNPGKAVHA